MILQMSPPHLCRRLFSHIVPNVGGHSVTLSAFLSLIGSNVQFQISEKILVPNSKMVTNREWTWEICLFTSITLQSQNCSPAQPISQSPIEGTMADVEGYKAEIRRSFALVEPIAVQAAAIFYPTLWEVNPGTKVSFSHVFVRGDGCSMMIGHLGNAKRRSIWGYEHSHKL